MCIPHFLHDDRDASLVVDRDLMRGIAVGPSEAPVTTIVVEPLSDPTTAEEVVCHG
jgi:hypothetical protein